MSSSDKRDKKRVRRKHYLNDFKADESGKYSYKGKHYYFAGSKQEFRKMTVATAALSVCAFALSLLPELLPPLSRPDDVFDFCVIPWILQTVFAAYLLWAALRLSYHGDGLREYVYRKTAETVPRRALVCAIGSIVTLGARGVFFAMYGFGETNVLAALSRPLCSLLCAAACSAVYRMTVKAAWTARS